MLSTKNNEREGPTATSEKKNEIIHHIILYSLSSLDAEGISRSLLRADYCAHTDTPISRRLPGVEDAAARCKTRAARDGKDCNKQHGNDS